MEGMDGWMEGMDGGMEEKDEWKGVRDGRDRGMEELRDRWIEGIEG